MIYLFQIKTFQSKKATIQNKSINVSTEKPEPMNSNSGNDNWSSFYEPK